METGGGTLLPVSPVWYWVWGREWDREKCRCPVSRPRGRVRSPTSAQGRLKLFGVYERCVLVWLATDTSRRSSDSFRPMFCRHHQGFPETLLFQELIRNERPPVRLPFRLRINFTPGVGPYRTDPSGPFPVSEYLTRSLPAGEENDDTPLP